MKIQFELDPDPHSEKFCEHKARTSRVMGNYPNHRVSVPISHINIYHSSGRKKKVCIIVHIKLIIWDAKGVGLSAKDQSMSL